MSISWLLSLSIVAYLSRSQCINLRFLQRLDDCREKGLLSLLQGEGRPSFLTIASLGHHTAILPQFAGFAQDDFSVESSGIFDHALRFLVIQVEINSLLPFYFTSTVFFTQR